MLEDVVLHDLLVVGPTTQDHEGTVIFLHELGQNIEIWLPIIEKLTGLMSGVKWILPQACVCRSVQNFYFLIDEICLARPERVATLDEHAVWTSWFDLESNPLCVRDNASARASISLVEEFILSEVHTGLDCSRIVIVGFGQGAALSMMVSLTTLHDLGGVACLSGWIPSMWRQEMVHIEPNLPVFWCHGTDDEVVSLATGEDSVAFLRDILHYTQENLTCKLYGGLEHVVNDLEIEDLAQWLMGILS